MHIPSTVWAEPPWPFAAELPRPFAAELPRPLATELSRPFATELSRPLAPESGCAAEGRRLALSRRLPAPLKPSPAPAASGEQPEISKRAAPAKPTAGLQAVIKPLEPLPPVALVLPDPDARP
jgi:hypothetical protein